MEKQDLKQIKISEYMQMLRDGIKVETINEINEALNAQLVGVNGGFDLALFQMEKDALLFHCKYILAMLEFNSEKMKLYASKIDYLAKQISKKKKKAEVSNPYKSFLQWLLTLKKYYGSDIDKNEDLFYLVEATNSMMKWYSSQNEELEKQKAKR
jgi:hypothetical protein